jgi:hypothetical protein
MSTAVPNLEDIRRVFREEITEVLATHGFDVKNPHESQADMHYVRSQRKASEKIADWVKNSAIVVVVTALLGVLWIGVKSAIKD